MRSLLWLALAGCGMPNQDDISKEGPLWDASSVVTAADGLYVPLRPSAGLAFLPTDGDAVQVDIGAGRLTRVSVPPAGDSALAAVVERYSCNGDPKDVKKMDVIADCPTADLEVSTEIDLVSAGAVTSVIPLEGPFDSLVWSADGSHAIAWIDVNNVSALDGVVNLTSVVVIDVAAGTATPVSVGFAANRVVFDDVGARAIVLSQSTVAVIDLATNPPSRDVTFSLVLDPDQVVQPVGVNLTPDGRYALISTSTASDLYVLDLENHSVNLVSLVGRPSAMQVETTLDRTVLVYGNTPRVEILDHQFFDLETLQLDEPMTAILPAETFVMLYAPGSRDVYRLDLETQEIEEFRLQQNLLSLRLAPEGDFSIALTANPNAGAGMEVLDLRDALGHSYPYLLENTGVDVRFDTTDGGLHALLLQENVDYLYDLDVLSGNARQVDLEAPPVAIGELPGGGFYVTHDAALGLVSLFDSSSGEITKTYEGFGVLGLFDEVALTEGEAQ